MKVVRDRNQDAIGFERRQRQSRKKTAAHSESQSTIDAGPRGFEDGNIGRCEVLNLEGDVVDVAQDQAGLEYQVFGESKSMTNGVEIVDEAMHFVAGVERLELCGGDAEQEIRFRQDRPATVCPDKDIKDLVKFLAVFEVETDQSFLVYRLWSEPSTWKAVGWPASSAAWT